MKSLLPEQVLWEVQKVLKTRAVLKSAEAAELYDIPDEIDSDHPDSLILLKAVEYLNTSGVIAHATETVYGLAARWDD